MIEIVARFLFDRGGELAFLLGEISFRVRKPSGDNMKMRRRAIVWIDIVERFARGIDLLETERGRGKIELALQSVRLQPRDLRAPRDRLRAVLFLARLRQNVVGGQ